jgi:hypothetical protein
VSDVLLARDSIDNCARSKITRDLLASMCDLEAEHAPGRSHSLQSATERLCHSASLYKIATGGQWRVAKSVIEPSTSPR